MCMAITSELWNMYQQAAKIDETLAVDAFFQEAQEHVKAKLKELITAKKVEITQKEEVLVA